MEALIVATAGLRDVQRLAVVLLGVEHLMRDVLLGEQARHELGLLHRGGADQHRLTTLVAVFNLGEHLAELLFLSLVDHVVVVYALNSLVGGDRHDLELVDVSELFGFGERSSGHAGELAVHAEEVLEGDRRVGLALGLDGDALFGLDRLVQAVRPAATVHQAPGVLVDDGHLGLARGIGAHDVVFIALEQEVRLQRLVYMVEVLHVHRIVQVAHAESRLDLVDAFVGQADLALLFVDSEVDLFLQHVDLAVDRAVAVDGVIGGAGDDQRRTCFIDEDRVDFIDDRVVVAALDVVLQLELHVVAEVVEAELVVRAVGDVGRVRRPFCSGVVALSGEDLAVGEPEEVVDSTHPVGIATREVVVDGDDVHAFAGQRVQVDRAGRDKGFALTRLHLGDHAAVQHHAADKLDVEVTHIEHAPARFTHHAEGFGEQVIERLTVVDALLEVGGARAQIFVGEREVLRLQLADAGDGGLKALDQAVSGGAEYLGEYNIEAEHAGILFGAGSSARSLVRTRSGGAVGESRRRCLKPGAYNCSHRPVERRRYFVSSCSGVELSGGVGEISLFCGRVRAQ